MNKIIDSHIHLDQYSDEELRSILLQGRLENCTNWIAVSNHLESCKRTRDISLQFPEISPAYGFHPEQLLPSEEEKEQLFSWLDTYKDEMVAVGEIGLPTYLQREQPDLDMSSYIELLERFLSFAATWDKPVNLHAVYHEAEIVCDVLLKFDIKHAHFHWFKGNKTIMRKMAERGYMISVTPEVVYRSKIQDVVAYYPIDLMMVETDSPWQFDGPYATNSTNPSMIHDAIQSISELKSIPKEVVYKKIYQNTQRFYFS